MVDAVVSSLGHNLTFKGMYFPPRMLCVDSVRLICDAARQLAPPTPLRLVVVSTEGVDRPDGADPKRGLLERLLLFLLWLLFGFASLCFALLAFRGRGRGCGCGSSYSSRETVGGKRAEAINRIAVAESLGGGKRAR